MCGGAGGGGNVPQSNTPGVAISNMGVPVATQFKPGTDAFGFATNANTGPLPNGGTVAVNRWGEPVIDNQGNYAVNMPNGTTQSMNAYEINDLNKPAAAPAPASGGSAPAPAADPNAPGGNMYQDPSQTPAALWAVAQAVQQSFGQTPSTPFLKSTTPVAAPAVAAASVEKNPDNLASKKPAASGEDTGTMLTGQTGVDPNTLALGKNTLLGN